MKIKGNLRSRLSRLSDREVDLLVSFIGGTIVWLIALTAVNMILLALVLLR